MPTKIKMKIATGNYKRLGATSNRLIIRSWGRDKTGKNHFGYTMPGPIFGQYFDPGGTEGVADKFMNGGEYGDKEIHGVQYRFNKARMDQSEAIEIRDKFIDDLSLRWLTVGACSGTRQKYGNCFGGLSLVGSLMHPKTITS